MKINKYLFIIILIVILCILYYCFYNKTIENLESEQESAEIAQKQSALQKIIDEFSGSVRQQIKDMIFSKTSESKKDIDDALQKNTDLRENIEASEDMSDDELTQKIDNLISVIEKDIQAVESTANFNVRRGISIEIDEQDKIRSIVNKYLI